MSEQTNDFYKFDEFTIDVSKRLLRRAGTPVPLKPKVFDTLLVLVENSGRVLDKDELMQTIWPDTAIEENNLTQNISAIRKHLGERRDEHRYVVTIPGRGYRFVADVRKLSAAENGKVGGSQLEREATDTAGLVGEEAAVGLQDAAIPPVVPRTRYRLLAIVTLVLLASLTGIVVVVRHFRSSTQTNPAATNAGTNKEVDSIAVLPFDSLGEGAGDEYTGPGMTDALITKLSNSRQLKVRSTSAVLRYSDPSQDPLIAGRELGVDSVLDGKIQRVGDRVRVTVQLVRVGDGATLWAQTFDGNFTDIFTMQDSISEQVAEALTLQLSREERERMRKRYTKNTEAYQAFLKGHYFMNKGPREDMERSTAYFKQAIMLDPDYAMAYAGLADSYRQMVSYGVPPSQVIPQSRAAATRALEIDDSIGYAHSMLGVIAYRYDWDFPRAEREYKRARELDPGLVHQWYAFYLLSMNRTDEADVEIKNFAQDQPFSMSGNSSFGLYYVYKRQYDAAAEQLRKTIEMDASYPSARDVLGLVYEQKGLYAEAIAEFQKAIDLSDGSVGTEGLGHVYALQGRKEQARAVLRQLEERQKRVYVPPFNMAVVYAGLGEKDEAFKWLEKGFTDHTLLPGPLRFDPRLDSLRDDERFKDLLRRVGLPF